MILEIFDIPAAPASCEIASDVLKAAIQILFRCQSYKLFSVLRHCLNFQHKRVDYARYLVLIGLDGSVRRSVLAGPSSGYDWLLASTWNNYADRSSGC